MANEKRLIDANATEKVMNERYKALAAEYGHYDHYTTGYGDALCVVEDAPTVDAVEVVHGKWIIDKWHSVSSNPYMDDNYHTHADCSECDFRIGSLNNSFWYPEIKTTKYCPNCGAKMDGDGNG